MPPETASLRPPVNPEDLRRFPRHPFRILATAEWMAPGRDGRPRARPVEVLDVGAGGVRFVADDVVQRGERLRIHIELGTVDDRFLRILMDVRWARYQLPPQLGRHTCGAAWATPIQPDIARLISLHYSNGIR